MTFFKPITTEIILSLFGLFGPFSAPLNPPSFAPPKYFLTEKNKTEGGSPGPGVMGDNSKLRGREFESQRCILDGLDIFLHLFVVKIVKFFKKSKNKRKRSRGWPIFKITKPIETKNIRAEARAKETQVS